MRVYLSGEMADGVDFERRNALAVFCNSFLLKALIYKIMRSLSLVFCFLLLAGLLTGCGGEETTVVESGVYEGTISEVNADEREIYVDVPDTGTLELYFTDSTRVLTDTAEVSFDELRTNQSVAVEVEKVGQRLDPVTVTIQEDDS